MTLALAVKLVSAAAYVLFSVAALGSAVYLWFARSARDEKVGELFSGLMKTRVKLDLMYLVGGLAATVVATGLAVLGLGGPGNPGWSSVASGIVLLLYYVPLTAASFWRRKRAGSDGTRGLAWLTVAGALPLAAAVALQYLAG